MASLNSVFLIGNLTRDPELRFVPGGTAVSNLRLAVNEKYRDSNGELKDTTCFLTVVVWGKMAESCSQYLSKGSPIFVEGSLQSRSWETQDGQKRSVLEVKAKRVQFLGKPQDKNQSNKSDDFDTTDEKGNDASPADEEVPF
jgi:single-strand DNA-binding protein